MMLKATEHQIQKTILAYLSHRKNIYFFRLGSGLVTTEQGNYFKSGKPGCPDIVVCFRGRFIGFEVKSISGKQSPHQKLAEQTIIKAGGEYYIVRSLEEVIIILGEK